MSARARELLARLVAFARTDDRFETPFATVSVGPIHGGVALDIVPESCTFDAEIRLLPGQDPGFAEDRVRQIAAALEAVIRERAAESRVEVTRLSRYPGLADSPGAASAKVAALADESRGGSADFGTEAGLYQAALDVPVVVCGPGDMAQGTSPTSTSTPTSLDRAERFVHRIAEALARPG